MHPVNVIAVFCEDIREEIGETKTLVGVLPDNVNVQMPTAAQGFKAERTDRFLLKLSIYARIHFDPDHDFGDVKFYLIFPDGKSVDFATIDLETVRNSRASAREKGNPLAGLILQGTLAGFRPPKSGTIRIEADIAGTRYLAGALNFKMEESTTPSSDSRLPSLQ